MKWRSLWVSLLLIVSGDLAHATDFGPRPPSGPQRPLRVEDVLSIEGLPDHFERQATFSPDGEALVFATVRSAKADPANWPGYWTDQPHEDLFVELRPGGRVTRITDGLSDSSGWFDPQWSPSGQRLLMKSTRGGSARLWVWERGTGELHLLESQPLDVSRRPAAVWVDDTRIVFCSLPPGVQPWELFPLTPRLATAGWDASRQGVESSASLLRSGIPDSAPTSAQTELRLLDALTGESKVLVQGDFGRFELSPDRRWIAVQRSAGPPAPRADQPLSHREMSDWVEVVDLAGRVVLGESHTGRGSSLGSWSPKSDELAFWTPAGISGPAAKLYRARLSDLKLTALELGPLEAVTEVTPQWTATGELLISGANGHEGQRTTPESRHDWFVVSRGKPPRNLTETLAIAPKLLLPLLGRETFIAVTAGMMWRFSVTGKAPTRPSGVAVPGIEAVESVSAEKSCDTTDLIVRGSDSSSAGYFVLDCRAGTLTPLAQPEPGAQLGTYSSRSKAAVFYSSEAVGTFVWRTSPQDVGEVLRTANRWLEHIAAGERRCVDYESLEGEQLKAWLILPPGYEKGRRYPLLTWVYAGDVKGSRPDPETQIGHSSSLNLQLAAAKGYAVLLPSMPLKGTSHAHEVLASLRNGVLPAVDRVIADGFADPERLFVAGHSFGGFSTYGLIGQTGRFKAAVAMAGMTDFVSYFGSVDARFRYGDSLADMFFVMETVENGQPGMGGPPWKDLDRYWRNSPLTYAERVHTPLLMIHGDMDPIPLEQAEEFFASLYRQGKLAQLVRYWGESHVIHSPANVRDLWSRIFAWLDRYGDIVRDSTGEMLFDGDHARSRGGAPALEAADFLKFEAQADQVQ